MMICAGNNHRLLSVGKTAQHKTSVNTVTTYTVCIMTITFTGNIGKDT